MQIQLFNVYNNKYLPSEELAEDLLGGVKENDNETLLQYIPYELQSETSTKYWTYVFSYC